MGQINNLNRGQVPELYRRVKRTETASALTDSAFDYDELETTTEPPNVHIGADGVLRRCV